MLFFQIYIQCLFFKNILLWLWQQLAQMIWLRCWQGSMESMVEEVSHYRCSMCDRTEGRVTLIIFVGIFTRALSGLQVWADVIQTETPFINSFIVSRFTPTMSGCLVDHCLFMSAAGSNANASSYEPLMYSTEHYHHAVCLTVSHFVSVHMPASCAYVVVMFVTWCLFHGFVSKTDRTCGLAVIISL